MVAATFDRESKDERVSIRLSARVKRELQEAADERGITLSDYVTAAAMERRAAERVEIHLSRLSERDSRRFFDAIDNPPEPNEALRDAFRWYEENVTRG